MDKESIYELQLIDCNCNDCIFMQRDFDTYKKWETFHKKLEEDEFNKAKQKAMDDAKAMEDQKARESMMRVAERMRFQFDKSNLIQYGNCVKFDKPVSFIPNVCQINTQSCFKHRKDENKL